jgi:probable F420-dependent oxidoreductase
LADVQLGTTGVWVGSRVWRGSEHELVEVSPELEQLGFGAVWLGSALSDLALPRSILAATRSLVVATGILNIWLSSPDDVAAAYAELDARYPGRLLLGLGASHAENLAPRGISYRRPYETMIGYLDMLDSATPPVARQDRVLAALGPRFLRLAAERSAGAHPYLVTPRHTFRARQILGASPLLAPEVTVVLEEDPAKARLLARAGIRVNLDLDNYRRSLARQGYEAADLGAGGSDRLIDDLVAWGSPARIAGWAHEHLAAGADHVAVQVVTGNDQVPIRQWRQVGRAMAEMSGR